MNDIGQLQLVRTAVCDRRGGQHCGTVTNDTAVCDVTTPLRQCSCSRPKLAIYSHRQTSVTSGDSGLSLDPITENHDYGEEAAEDKCAHCSQVFMISETCNSRRHECISATDDNPSDESDLITKPVCERYRPNSTEKLVSGSRRSEQHAISRTQIFRNARVRTRSESCVGDNIVIPARDYSHPANSCGHLHPHQHVNKASDVMGEIRQKEYYDFKEIRILRRRYRQLLCLTVFVFVISSVSIVIAIVGNSNNGSKYTDMNSKVNMTLLKEFYKTDMKFLQLN